MISVSPSFDPLSCMILGAILAGVLLYRFTLGRKK